MYKITITQSNGRETAITSADELYNELSIYALLRMLDKCSIDKFSFELNTES